MPSTAVRRWHLVPLLLVLLVPALGSAAYATFSSTTTNAGSSFDAVNSFGLTQPAGTGGCVAEDPALDGCTDALVLSGPVSIALSPLGEHLYAGLKDNDAVAAFVRDGATGALTPVSGTGGCVTDAAVAGCTDGTALVDASDVVVSPDGKHVYTVSETSDAVVAFSRNLTSGALTQLSGTSACVSEGGVGGCTTGRALDFASGLAISGDGKHVYAVAANSDAIAVFSRNATTGALTQLSGTAGCISLTGNSGTCAIAPRGLDQPMFAAMYGDTLYVTTHADDAVSVWRRNTTTGALTYVSCVSAGGHAGQCATAATVVDSEGMAISPDGTSAYVTGLTSSAVTVLHRNADGSLAPQACISDTGSGGCTDGTALARPDGVAVSQDGESVYVTAQNSDAVTVFHRDPATGSLTEAAGLRACVSETGGVCTDGRALDAADAVAVSPDDRDVYVAGYFDRSIAVLPRRR